MTTPSKYDFIIVGAGPIGCITAQAFFQRGFRVLILEKTSWNRCASPLLNGVSEVYYELFQKLEIIHFLTDTLVNNGSHIMLTTPKGIKLEELREEDTRRIFFNREIFDHKLRQQIIKNVDVLDQVSTLSLIRNNGKVVGIQCTHQSTKKTFFCDLLIGCDGPHSTIAKLAGLSSGISNFHYLYQGRVFSSTTFPSHFTGLFPLPQKKQLALAFSIDPLRPGHTYLELETNLKNNSRRPDKLNFESFFAQSIQASKHLADACRNATAIGDWKTRTVKGIQRSRLQTPGLILLGDSACCLDPISSSGLLFGLLGLNDLLSLSKKGLHPWNLHTWEKDYVNRVKKLNHFVKLMRFLLQNSAALEAISRLIEKKIDHRKEFLDVFNGIKSYDDFLHWTNQLKFWSSLIKS